MIKIFTSYEPQLLEDKVNDFLEKVESYSDFHFHIEKFGNMSLYVIILEDIELKEN